MFRGKWQHWNIRLINERAQNASFARHLNHLHTFYGTCTQSHKDSCLTWFLFPFKPNKALQTGWRAAASSVSSAVSQTPPPLNMKGIRLCRSVRCVPTCSFNQDTIDAQIFLPPSAVFRDVSPGPVWRSDQETAHLSSDKRKPSHIPPSPNTIPLRLELRIDLIY